MIRSISFFIVIIISSVCAAQKLPAKALKSKYRVQISAFSTNNKKAALYDAKKAAAKYGLNTYIVLENEMYKVHLGDFFSKKNTASFLTEVQKIYKDAWVAKANNSEIIQSFLTDSTPKKTEKKIDDTNKIEKKTKSPPPSKLPSSWDHKYYTAALTAANIKYLSKEEKEVFYYLNLARMNPPLFAKTYLMTHIGTLRTSYQKSLYQFLINKDPLPILHPKKELWESAKCHAIQSGKTGYVGHERSGDCEANYNGECCAYGRNNAIDTVVSLLIDEGIPSLGHRKICMGNFSYLGVAIREHKTYRVNVVMDFAY